MEKMREGDVRKDKTKKGVEKIRVSKLASGVRRQPQQRISRWADRQKVPSVRYATNQDP